MIDKQYVINNVSNIEKLPNVTILKMLMQFKEQLETSGAYHSITIGEVNTLEAEEPAYVENVGTSTDLILNFGIPKGVGFNFSGEWVSDDNEYHPNDVVLFNGNLYICISTILDSETSPNIDTTHWSLFVGYGNDISEFVKGEWEKCVNLSQVNSSATGNFNLGANIESGKTYSISFYCQGYRSFALKKNNNSGASLLTKYDFQGNFEYTFTADWTGDLYINGWASSVSPTGNSYSNIMINEGGPLPYQPYNGEIIHRGDIEPVVLFEGSLNTIGATFSADFTPYEKLLIHGSFYNETTIFELDLTRKSYAGGYTSSHSSITKNVDGYDCMIVNVNDEKNTFTLVNGGYNSLGANNFTEHVGYDIFIYKVEGVKSI